MLELAEESAAEATAGQSPLTAEEGLALFRAALGKDECRGLLLAVSGGPDSMALLGLAGAARAFLPPLAVATIDHNLRPGSHAEAEAVGRFARELGIPHQIIRWTDRPKKAGPVSQEEAREGRYALLLSHARAIEASHLATAHTLDDQAETVMIRLSAGSGTAGLGGMRPNVRRGALVLVRPFLDVPKARLVATCDRHGWNFSDDPSNADPRFKRVRMRALMPLLAGEGLTPARLSMLAERARRTEEAIDHVARRNVDVAELHAAEDGGALRLRAELFASEPFEIALRMLRQAVLRIGGEAADPQKLPLVKLEQLLRELRSAIREARPFRRTLAWAVIAHGAGTLEIRQAPPRRREQGTRSR